jgi:hypothetical protein
MVTMAVGDGSRASGPTLGELAYYAGLPMLAAAGLLAWVWARRDTYCPRPTLAPHLTYPWRSGGAPPATVMRQQPAASPDSLPKGLCLS